MANFDDNELKNLFSLCRLECTEEQKALLTKDLKKIMGYFELLNEVDTESVLPCNHVLSHIHTVTREDTTGKTLNRDTFLSLAPSHTGGMIKVPPVIK